MENDTEKVGSLFLNKNSVPLNRKEKAMSVMRFTSLNVPLKKPLPVKFRTMQVEKISSEIFYKVEGGHELERAFHQAALETYRCCQEQGLHLLDLKKNYEEKCHPLRKAMKKWDFQEVSLARSRIPKRYVAFDDLKKHTIRKISGKSSPVQQP